MFEIEALEEVDWVSLSTEHFMWLEDEASALPLAARRAEASIRPDELVSKSTTVHSPARLTEAELLTSAETASAWMFVMSTDAELELSTDSSETVRASMVTLDDEELSMSASAP